MTGVAAAIGGAAVVGAGVAVAGSKTAADSQRDAANQANSTQQGMFNTIQQNESPWVQTGSQAQNALAQYYGLAGTGGTAGTGATAGATPDYNSILSNLPGYQFQLQQGTQAVDQNLAASGLLQSGAAGKALQTYGQGLASQYANTYTSGLAGLSQLGQAGAAGVASAGMNSANQQGANDLYSGNASAAGTANATNAIGTGLSGLASSYGASQYNPYSYATNANNYGSEFTPAAGNAGYLEGP